MMQDYELTQLFYNKGIRYVLTGSRYICSPPVIDTDTDIVAVFDIRFNPEKHGFIRTNQSEEYGSTDFETYRNGNLNLIIVDDRHILRRWEVATAAAKQLNIKNKKERIELFQGVLYGNW